MIEFTNICIEGFCSIPKLDLPLNSKGITIIRGYNGFGKSTIFSAISWVLYGYSLKGKSDVNTWKKVQPKDYKGTKVEIFFRSEDNKIHRIIRCQKYTKEVEGASGANRLIYQIDGDTISDRGKRNIQSVINQALGMSYNLFINSIMFGQGLKRLVQESGANQREIFEEIFNLGYLTKAKKIAQDKYNEANKEYLDINSKLSYIKDNIGNLEDNIKLVKSKQSTYNSDLKTIIKNLKSKKKELKAKLSSLKDELSKLSNSQDILAKIHKINSDIQSNKSNLTKAQGITGISLENLIDKIIKLLSNKKYEDSLNCLKQLKDAFSSQEKYKQNIISLREQLEQANKENYAIKSKQSLIDTTQNQLDSVKAQIKQKKQENPQFEDIITQNKHKLTELRSKTKDLDNQLASYKESRDLYQWAYTDPLGNSGIKSYLFESCLEELNNILGSYSETLGFYIQFGVNMSSARKDFYTTIIKDGQNVAYEELSGGQQQLVNLAMAFAMNTIVSRAQNTNIAFLDEVFEHLSEDNIEIVVNLIKKVYKEKTLFLITHLESLPISNSRVLRVKYDKGLSQYIM